MKILPTKQRFGRRLDRYPNKMTTKSLAREIEARVLEGFSPVGAFLTVAEGVKNWAELEGNDVGRGGRAAEPRLLAVHSVASSA